MKRKKADEMIQTAVRLPQSLRERLSSAGGEGGLGEEIRRRLEASFEADKAPVDPKTRKLLEEIERLALNTPLDVPWYADGDAFEVFKNAIVATLAKYQPSGDAAGPTGRLQGKFGKDATHEMLGRMLAGVTGTFRRP